MTLSTSASVHTVAVPGATLHYEVRGSGKTTVVVVGSPMGSAEFAPLADALAADYTVVTLDPRGIANSTIDDPTQDATPELRAGDVAAVLDALGVESADVVGSSGGAVTGLALAARYPQRVRALVAHEPPLLELLDDAAQQRANTENIIATYHAEGMQAAWFTFMVTAGFDMSAPPGGDAPEPSEPPEPSEQELREAARFFDHELRATTQYIPRADELTGSRIVVGIGAQSAHLLTYRTSMALCELLGSRPVEFPGDHGGFMSHPGAFADRLREVLA
jgi:pimeloyl-ACP methyl ester carboxylesterase